MNFRHLFEQFRLWRKKIDSYRLGDIKVSVYKTDDPNTVLVHSKGPKKYENEFEVPAEIYKKNKELVKRRIINEFKSKFDYHMFG